MKRQLPVVPDTGVELKAPELKIPDVAKALEEVPVRRTTLYQCECGSWELKDECCHPTGKTKQVTRD